MIYQAFIFTVNIKLLFLLNSQSGPYLSFGRQLVYSSRLAIGVLNMFGTMSACGMCQVVDRNWPWEGGLVAINSFGFGGANAHVILQSERGRAQPAPPPAAYCAPRVLAASGRSELAVRALLDHARAHPADHALHALIDSVHAYNIPGHSHRGYTVLTDSPVEEILVSSVAVT